VYLHAKRRLRDAAAAASFVLDDVMVRIDRKGWLSW
jgi:hypothetical protein